MKRFKRILMFTIIIGVAVSAILIRTSGATSEMNQYNENLAGETLVYDNSFGQTFIPTKSGQVDKIEIYGKRQTLSTTATASIYATDANGVATGSPLGTSSTLTVPGTLGWNIYVFTLGNRASLNAFTKYAIVVTANKSMEYHYHSTDTYSSGTRLIDGSLTGSGDLLFRMFMTPSEYTVTFMNETTPYNTQTVEYGNNAIAPLTDPTKTDYTFTYWDNYNNITADRTVYANYTINSYTITFDSYGGSSVASITQDYGTSVTAPANPTRAGYTFDTWCSDTGLEAPYTFSTMPSGGITLYAKWTVNQYTITFNSNGGSSVDPITQNYLTYVSAPTPPSKSNYTFAGWFSDEGLTTAYTFNTMPLDGITLNAKWVVNQYTITFDSFGGTIVNAITQAYGSSVTAPTPPTRTGYGFDGWYSDSELTTPYAFTTMPAGGITLYAKWVALTPHDIIYAANDSESGTAPTDATSYTMGATVTTMSNTGFLYKEGYGFSEWNTAPDGSGEGYPVGSGSFIMGIEDVTLYPVFVKTEVTLKDKTESGFTVNIKGWQTDFIYQIWNYSELTSDIFLDGKERKANQWLLSLSCSLGSEGEIQPDGSINYYIDLFTSPSNNYTVAVRIANEKFEHVSVLKDTLTEAEYIKINKIKVDGEFAEGIVTREIKTGATVPIEIITNITAGTTYTATVVETSQTLTAEPGEPNVFIWDIEAKNPRTYTVRFTATNNTIHDTREIRFALYKIEGVTYASIDSMNMVLDSNLALPRSLTLTPSYANGYFYYKIAEPGREGYFKSSTFTNHNPINHSLLGYGYFQVVGITNRADVGPNRIYYDDGIIKYVNVPRSNSSSTMTFTSDVDISNPVNKGTAINFTAEASIAGIGATPVQYSFWRSDANGGSLIKDWSSDNTLDWKPARVGRYIIQARAKGEDALSYEVIKTVTVNVVDTIERIAENVVISLNSSYLIANARPREAIVIQATVSSETDEDLLYKFSVYDEDMDTASMSGYSPDPQFVWIPREARTYYITVYVKNRSSFGVSDAYESFQLTVQ